MRNNNMTKLLNHINTYESEADYQNDNSKNFPNVSYIVENVNVLFEVIRYEQQYFAIESLEDDNAIMFKLSSDSGSPSASSAKTISVSTDDGGTWTDYTSTADGTTIATLNMGQKVLIRGNNNTYVGSGFRRGFSCFTASKQIDVNGNIMSLIYGDNFKEQYSFPGGTNYNFQNIFNSAPIVSAENLILPATTLAKSCYENMFEGCTSLTTAPKLPATTLAKSCYENMFYGTNVLPDCTNIDFTSKAVLDSGGLIGLFAGTKVTDSDLDRLLPKNTNGKYYLPATTLANYCYADMFRDCTNLVTAPDLPATTLANGCYENMFYGCRNLVTAPDLPATTLANYCYHSMFYGCTSMTSAPSLLPATTLADNCYQSMFQRCTSLTTAPTLPAKTLASDCYWDMFAGCTSLNYIKCLATDISANGCLSTWVNGVAASGTFVKNSAATWNVTGANGVPTGWTIQKASS